MNDVIEIRVHGVSGTPAEELLTGPAEHASDAPPGTDVWRRSERSDGVRAFRWGNLTSGRPRTALWMALLPYLLLNLAGWALPPMGRFRHRLAVVTIRAAGLALTMIFTIVAAIGFIGIGGYLVIRPWLGTHVALTLGAIATIALVAILWWAGSRDDSPALADRRYLRPLHMAVSAWGVWWTLVAATREAYGPVDVSVLLTGGAGRAWPIPVAAGIVVLIAGLVRRTEALARPAGWALLAGSSTLLAVDVFGVITRGVDHRAIPGRLADIYLPLRTIVEVYALLALLALALALTRRHKEAGAVIGSLLALAGSTGAGFGAAAIWVAAQPFAAAAPRGIGEVAEAFSTGTSVVLLALAIVFVRSVVVDRPVLRSVYRTIVATRNGLFPVLATIPIVTAMVLGLMVFGQEGELDAPGWFARFTAIVLTITALALVVGFARLKLVRHAGVVGGVAVIGWALSFTGWFDFTGVAVAFTLVIPLALIVARVWGALHNADRRRELAVPWDVGSFFPRRFHPFAPPSYRDTAVAELHGVIEHYRDAGHTVIVGAHSQGTVICSAALMAIDDARDTAFLSYGSPLASLYARFFPRYFDDGVFTGLAADLPGGWINLWRNTDPISGPIRHGPTDREIADPKVRGHASYWAADEPDFAAALDDLGSRLGASTRPSQQM